MFTPLAGNEKNSEGIREEVTIVEVSLLLTAWEFDRLMEAASRRGLTIGQMIREITGEYLSGPVTRD